MGKTILPAVLMVLLTALPVQAREDARSLVIEHPPGEGWITVVDRPLRGSSSSEAAGGEGASESEGWIRGWASGGGSATEDDFLFVMLYPAESPLEARLFVAGGLEEARSRGESLPPFAGVGDVERARFSEGGMVMEMAAFARDRVGVQIVATGAGAISVLEETAAAQIAVLPVVEPAPTSGGGLLPGLGGLMVGAAAGLAINAAGRRRVVNPWVVGAGLVVALALGLVTVGGRRELGYLVGLVPPLLAGLALSWRYERGSGAPPPPPSPQEALAAD